MEINLHHSIMDLSDLDLIDVEVDSWPCLDFYTETGLVEVVWVTEPHDEWLISRGFIRLRIPAGIGAQTLRESMQPGRPLAAALGKAGDVMENGCGDPFEACDVAAAHLRKLGT